MRDFLVNGTRVLTSDEVAEAILDYARELTERGQTAIVRFPAIVEGSTGDTWMSIGAGTTMLAIESDSPLPVSLEGSEFATWNIRRRHAVLAGDNQDLDWRR